MSKKHDWNKEQPHHVDSGEFVKKDSAESIPAKLSGSKRKSELMGEAHC